MPQSKVATERTRQALLDAAEQLFWQRSPARTSVFDIARTAGLTRRPFIIISRKRLPFFEGLLARARAADPFLPSVDEGEDAEG